MSSLNKVTLIGRLGKEPEIRVTQSGDKIANLTLATSESWTSKQTGQKEEKTEWHRVVVFGKIAEVIEKYVKKGDQIYLEGKLVTRKWTDRDNQERYTTEVNVTQYDGKMLMLASQNKGQSTQPAPAQQPAAAPAAAPKKLTADEGAPFDDEIPF